MFRLQILLRLIAFGTPLDVQPITTTRMPNRATRTGDGSDERLGLLASNDSGICKAAIRCLGEIEASEAVKMGRSRQIFAASLIRYQVSTTGTACLAMA